MLFASVMRNRARLNQALREKARALAESRAGAAGERGARGAHADRRRAARRRRARAERDDRAGDRRAAAWPSATRRAREDAFATVEATGREALTELRRLLGVLRREDEELGLAPQPSLAHIGSLVRRSQAAGLPVELRVEGEPRALPAGVDLTAYRLVQEALARARDAEAGRAAVILDYGASDLERRDRRRRRAASAAGCSACASASRSTAASCRPAPTEAGGWRVTARLPIGRAERGGAARLETLA